MGLRARLIFIVTLGLGVSLAASLGLLLRLEGQDLRREATERTAALLSALAAPISVLITQGRVVEIDHLMDELEQRRGSLQVESIVLVDVRGSTVASTAGGAPTAPDDPFVRRAIAASGALQDPPPPAWPERVSVPVQSGGRWATLIARLDEGRLEETIAHRRVRLIGSAVTVSVLGLVVLLLLLSWEVLAPVASIVAMAERLARGDLKARAPVRGATELVVLATTLNDAARKLGSTQEHLEAEVARRTEELSRACAELSHAKERLERLALTDPLTGLFNRRYLDQALALEITRQKRQMRPFALLYIDVDHFKHFNDSHGHPRGDALLQELARVLTRTLRASDIVARIGGEEFVIMLLDSDLPHAAAAAEKVRDAVAAHPFPLGDQQPLGRVTISLGVASWPRQGVTAAEVLAAADQALYRSKTSGRNRVMTADDVSGPSA